MFFFQSRKCWIEETFCKRDCVKFIPATRDLHRCSPVCQVCQNLIRCCCGRLIGEHSALDPAPPLQPPGELRTEEEWSIERHTRASPTDAFGTIDFQDGSRSCRAKYLRLSCDAKPEQLLQLMLRHWKMDLPKLVISVHGGTENFDLPLRVRQTFSKGLIKAAETTGAWIVTEGINTGVSRYVGDAVKLHGTHNLRKRYTVGIAPWGVIENHSDLMGKDVIRPYQTLGNPLSKRTCLNGLHSHFLLVDDGTVGKYGGQLELRRGLEAHLQLQKIHPRLTQGVPVVCALVEGGPGMVSLVLEYVRSTPPVPVIIFEGTGRAADILAFVHKQTNDNRQLDTDIKEDVLLRVQNTFCLGKAESDHLYGLLMECMDFRDSITIFDSESAEQQDSDTAILTALFKGTKMPAPDQLSTALAWDRVDIAKKHVLVYGQHWKVGSLEQAMLDALVMDRVSFVNLLIENGMTMNRFLTVSRLEELYNTQQGPANNLLYHLVKEVKQSYLPVGYRVSLIDVGLVIEYLIGGAYRSTYTRKHFRAIYNRLHGQRKVWNALNSPSMQLENEVAAVPRPHFFRTAQPYKRKEKGVFTPKSRLNKKAELNDSQLFVYNFNDLFVWAVLMRRQQMALFLWQHGEEAMARAVVACKLYRTMAYEAKQSNMGDSAAEELKTYSLEFGQLAVDLLDNAFRQNERMAMKLLTYEMKDWSNFTCLQMAVSSGLRPFVSHTCTQMLLTDLWMGRLNMRKNSWFKIILSIMLPPTILMLEFKSQAEMSHVPQPQEALQFGWDTGGPGAGDSGRTGVSHFDVEKGHKNAIHNPDVASHGILWTRKVYEFYNAPVVKFWFHSMAYLGFLMLYSYTVLVKMSPQPSSQEWLVIIYIFTTAVEKVREVFMSEPRKLSMKLKVWFSEYWNMNDFIAIVLFLIGFGLRWQDDPFQTAGRIVYCLDIIFWYVRLLDLFAVNQHAGPYLTMITKMTTNMFYIVVMMAIVLLSFGVSRKAILSPEEPPSWSLAKDVVFQPYWMMFGEVYAGEIDACAEQKPCPPGAFITPFLQAVYLFFQYIIMVNILIAFFNNVYFDMKSISNKLWKYNRYRYIMTYQEKPWLPPPFILLSHLTLCLSSIHRHQRRKSEQEAESGLKLYLCQEDLKKLHDFEEQCVTIYFHRKDENLHCSQENRIKSTTETAEEMCGQLQEVSEKVHFIKDTLQSLDSQLGHLQDMSALVVDTLGVISASDSLQVEEALLGQGRPLASSHRQLPHSWSHVGHMTPVTDGLCTVPQKQYCSTPPSLLRCLVHASRRPSLDRRWADGQDCGASQGAQSVDVKELDRNGPEPPATPCSDTPPLSFRHTHGHAFLPHLGSRERISLDQRGSHPLCTSEPPEHFYSRPWIYDSHLPPSQEDTMEEEEDREGEEEEKEEEDEEGEREEGESAFDSDTPRAFSHTLLLLDSRCESGIRGFVNPAFCEDKVPGIGPPGQGLHSRTCSRLACMCHEIPGPQPRKCWSLSASLESLGHPPKPPRSSVLPLDTHLDRNSWEGGRSHSLLSPGADTLLDSSQNKELSKSSEIYPSKRPGNKKKTHSRKTVKIQESDENVCGRGSDGHLHHSQGLLEPCWKRRLRGDDAMRRNWSASASLTQLNSEQMDLTQKCGFPVQESLGVSPSVWSSWAKSLSRRSSVQSAIGLDTKSSTFEDLDPHYSAVERNNLMRLAHTIPFTPISLLAGEEVSVYSLEESLVAELGSGEPSWSQRGLTALLQPLSHEEMDGGLRRATRVVCTWAEGDILKPGSVYIIKAFLPEVVEAWQRTFPGNTLLHLCLREIQQQRAAQKLMHIFNQIKPHSIPYSLRFLDVYLLHWHSQDQWLTIERNMSGDFRKYNNSTGEEVAPCCLLEETALAFSHWTYQYTRGELLVLDLQGVGSDLTDPAVIRLDNTSSPGDTVFGPASLGDDTIQSFVRKHICNSCCAKLHLSDLRRSNASPGKINPAFEEDSAVIMTRL
ncbi:transient receptor potential cation channel subfamily M member 6 [Megalops cyprinoides]|uniref:transient receptor potential cation channel subfamily M member 6 n=1 Tax=Megalops cyprinoides TaxID=118141 RepID=UPI0018651050|nr:transient receptor potential cation channel subfamily M member 6 [Megalops cyprinoides]